MVWKLGLHEDDSREVSGETWGSVWRTVREGPETGRAVCLTEGNRVYRTSHVSVQRTGRRLGAKEQDRVKSSYIMSGLVWSFVLWTLFRERRGSPVTPRRKSGNRVRQESWEDRVVGDPRTDSSPDQIFLFFFHPFDLHVLFVNRFYFSSRLVHVYCLLIWAS